MGYLPEKNLLGFPWISPLIPFFAIATCLTVCIWAPPASADVSPTSTGAATVRMTNSLKFNPATVTVPAGSSVEWRNTSNLVHSVTDDPSKGANADQMVLPPGAKAFNSGGISPNQVYKHKFAVPGVYHYVCSYHESVGMRGTVIVEARH